MIHFERQIRIVAWKELHTNADRSMKKPLSALTLAGMMWLGARPSEPAITDLAQATRTVARQSVSTAKIGQGMTRTIWITGPWMDWVNDVNGTGGVDGTIKATKQGITTGEVQIILNATASATVGEKTLTVDVKCPIIPLDCKPGPFPFKVRVFETGPINSITPTGVVAPDQQAMYTINGEGLNSAELLPRLTTLRNATIVTRTANTLTVRGTNPSCGGVDIEFVAAGGGDDMPYRKSAGLTLPIAGGACGSGFVYRPLAGTSTTGAPDLVPVAGSTAFRHVAANRKVASEPFCHGMFAQATTAIVRTITVGDLSWGVRNAGPVAVTTPFTVQLLRGGVIVDTETVQSLGAGETKMFTPYHRAQSQTEVGRLGLVPNAETRQIYNATGGECVQTVGQPTQYDWQDPQWVIRVDQANAVTAETNKTNNSRTF
jgi:hypothetical protein